MISLVRLDPYEILTAIIMVRENGDPGSVTARCPHGHVHTARILAIHPELSSVSCQVDE